MYFQLVKELIKWEKCKKNMIEVKTKRKQKKDVCHFAMVLKILFQKWFPLEGAWSHEKKQAKQPQEDKRRRDNLRQRFIENKKPLNLTHV